MGNPRYLKDHPRLRCSRLEGVGVWVEQQQQALTLFLKSIGLTGGGLLADLPVPRRVPAEGRAGGQHPVHWLGHAVRAPGLT